MEPPSNTVRQTYFRLTLSRAAKETWKMVFADHPVTVCVGIVVACLAIFMQRTSGQQSSEQMREAFISIGFGLGSYLTVFGLAFLLHFCYLTPKRQFATLESQFRSEDLATLQDLRVSVDETKIDTETIWLSAAILQRFGRLAARLIFTNMGHAPRTILNVELLYSDPKNRVLKEGRQLLTANNVAVPSSSFNPMLIPPDGSEIIYILQTLVDIKLCEKPDGEFGVLIAATDGMGGPSRSKTIMMMTIKQSTKAGELDFSPKSLSRISLDHDTA